MQLIYHPIVLSFDIQLIFFKSDLSHFHFIFCTQLERLCKLLQYIFVLELVEVLSRLELKTTNI